VFAALSVEAFFNELPTLDGWQSEDKPSLVALDERLKALRRVLELAEDHNIQSTGKLQLAHEILGRPVSRGDPPLQGYALLKQFRDAVVHAKPSSIAVYTTAEFESSRRKVLDALLSRGLLMDDPAKRGQPFLDWLNSPALGRWAIKTAAVVVIMTLDALPAGDFKDGLAIMLYRDFKSVAEGVP
jgi:hypothetical protein